MISAAPHEITAGLVLAAGSGSRYGAPKALVRGPDGLWVHRAVDVLSAGGCSPVLVAVGARAAEVIAALPPGVQPVPVTQFRTGMGASLRAGLEAAERVGATQVVVTLVDLPDLTSGVVARLLAHTQRGSRAELARAGFHGRPGHPVLIGSAHFEGVGAAAVADVGARDYLAARPVTLVECGDLASGYDVDRPLP